MQPMSTPLPDMTITGVQNAYHSGHITPQRLMQSIRQCAEELHEYNIFIHLLSESEQKGYLDALVDMDPDTHALWGIPFVLKDNIDLSGINTTAACPAFTYTPEHDAAVVQMLLSAGAIPVGKANLDQFATGLNGTRSPWGACRNSFNPAYVSGGSSAGSAVAVAMGLASFSLGTDTAGSGRVPAGFNNLVGLKPTRGLISAAGVVPACKSLDCVSIFALTTDDANRVLAVAEQFDESDEYSRSNPFGNREADYGYPTGQLVLGAIKSDQLEFYGSTAYEQAYKETLEILTSNGFVIQEIDYEPFAEAARLLYEGPWVAERYLAATPLIEADPDSIFPVVRQIIEPGGEPRATDLFKAQYRLQALKRKCLAELRELDCFLTPTAPCHFTIDEMLAEPVLRNSQLGHYTNYVNLLDLAAVALPARKTVDNLPFGVTLVNVGFSDRRLLSIANRVGQLLDMPLGTTNLSQPQQQAAEVVASQSIDIVVCGAHLDGLALNWQLTERGARLKEATKTSDRYRLYALAGGPVARPALVKSDDGAEIEAEIWTMPTAHFASFLQGIAAPLGIGSVELRDGRVVNGFICEMNGIDGAIDITEYGGWRAYKQAG